MLFPKLQSWDALNNTLSDRNMDVHYLCLYLKLCIQMDVVTPLTILLPAPPLIKPHNKKTIIEEAELNCNFVSWINSCKSKCPYISLCMTMTAPVSLINHMYLHMKFMEINWILFLAVLLRLGLAGCVEIEEVAEDKVFISLMTFCWERMFSFWLCESVHKIMHC